MIGPNGAGKTTVFNLISGFFHPDEGKIVFAGKDISRLAPHETSRMGIGRTFQIVKPLARLSVLENVMLGAFMHTGNMKQAEQEAEKILDFLQMAQVKRFQARGLPLAALKRLEIARALATKPKLILLDEVVSGLTTSEALALAESDQAFAGMGRKRGRRRGTRDEGSDEDCRPRGGSRLWHKDR